MRAFSFQPRRIRPDRIRPTPPTVLVGVVLLCGLLPAAPASAQWPGRVEGTVADASSGRPVADAVVASDAPGAVAGDLPTTTDASGRFVLTGLTPGRHLLVVRRAGYAPTRVEARVEEGRVTRLAVTLEPAPLAVAGVEVRVRRSESGAFRIEPAPGTPGTAGDLVESAPGVVVARRGPGGPETVSIRGSGAHEVLVLVDGVPLNDPVTGTADLSLVSAASVASMVVLPGARSARFGPRAQGGVVLLETRAPAPGVRGRATAGSLGLRGVEVGAGGMRDDATGWTVAATRETVDGAFDVRLPASAGGGETRRANADARHTSLSGGVDTPAGTGALRFRARVEEVERGLPGRTFAPSPHARQRDRRAQLSAGWRAPRVGPAGVDVDAHAWGAHVRSRVRDPAPPTGLPWDDRTRAWSGGGRVDVAGDAGGLRVGGGLDVRAQRVTSDALVGDGSTRIDAAVHASVEGEGAAGPARLTGRLTGRLHRADTGEGVVPTHEAALHATVPAGRGAAAGGATVSLHLAWRSAFTPPTLADQHFRSGVGVEPNPDLKAERIPAEIEAGLGIAAAVGPADLSASLTAWHGDVRDMIEWAPDFRFVWSPRNVDVLRRGLDARAELRTPAGPGAASVAVSWSRTRATYDREDGTPGGDGVQLRYRPRHAATVSAGWRAPYLDAGLTARYTGLRYPVPAEVNALPGFWSVDLSLRGRIRLGAAWELVPSLRIDRLFDATDALIFGFPHAGRSVAFGVEITGPGPGG